MPCSQARGERAAATALRPEPFLLGAAIAIMGLFLSFAASDSASHARVEAASVPAQSALSVREILVRSIWRDRALSSASQAGLVNNLNDGAAWGLLPLLFLSVGLDLQEVGLLAAIYPAVWGAAQLGTGSLSDAIGRRWLIVVGMFVQAAALALVATARDFVPALIAMTALGLGTAMVYPTLVAVVSDVVHPQWRATAIGVYRLWRDSGYVIGALLGGVVADRLGLSWAIAAVAALTFSSGLVALGRLPETHVAHGTAARTS